MQATIENSDYNVAKKGVEEAVDESKLCHLLD